MLIAARRRAPSFFDLRQPREISRPRVIEYDLPVCRRAREDDHKRGERSCGSVRICSADFRLDLMENARLLITSSISSSSSGPCNHLFLRGGGGGQRLNIFKYRFSQCGFTEFTNCSFFFLDQCFTCFSLAIPGSANSCPSRYTRMLQWYRPVNDLGFPRSA